MGSGKDLHISSSSCLSRWAVTSTSWFILKLSILVMLSISLIVDIADKIWAFAMLHLILIVSMAIWQKGFSIVALLTLIYWFSPPDSIQSISIFLLDQIPGALAFDIIQFVSGIAWLVLLLEVGLAVLVFERFLRYVKNAKLALWLVLLAIVGQAIWNSVLQQTGCFTVYIDVMGIDWGKLQSCQDLRVTGGIIFKLISAVGYLLFISELFRLRDSVSPTSRDKEFTAPVTSI